MTIVSIILVIILSLFLVVPYLVCMILKFALWKYQFSGKPTSPFFWFTYRDIILNVPLGLNQNLLISVRELQFKMYPNLKIHVCGLSISILIKNEFLQWKNHQIEMLKMLEDIRTRLRRSGLLSVNTGVSGLFKKGDFNQTSLSDEVENTF